MYDLLEMARLIDSLKDEFPDTTMAEILSCEHAVRVRGIKEELAKRRAEHAAFMQRVEADMAKRDA